MPRSLQEMIKPLPPLSLAQSSTLDETTQRNQSYTLRNHILRQRKNPSRRISKIPRKERLTPRVILRVYNRDSEESQNIRFEFGIKSGRLKQCLVQLLKVIPFTIREKREI